MAQLVANFTTLNNDNCSKLLIIDNSTENYGDQIITSRNVNISTADGETFILEFPIINGVGDKLEYPVDKDLIISITLTLIPQNIDQDSTYNITKDIINTCYVNKKRDELVRNNLLNSDPKNLLSLSFHKVKDIFMLDQYLDAALQYMGYGEFTTAQEALDAANEIADLSNC